MGILNKINGFSNPITGARRCLGTTLIIIGIVLLIPSLLLGGWASSKYESSKVFTDSYVFTLPTVGANTTLEVSDIMTAGNNYDIKFSVSITGPYTMEKTGQISMQLLRTGDLTSQQTGGVAESQTKSASNFNETTHLYFDSLIMEDFFAQDANENFTFTVLSLNNVSSISVELRVYENPNRTLVKILSPTAWIIAIPGILVLCCGCCIAPPTKKNQ